MRYKLKTRKYLHENNARNYNVNVKRNAKAIKSQGKNEKHVTVK